MLVVRVENKTAASSSEAKVVWSGEKIAADPVLTSFLLSSCLRNHSEYILMNAASDI